MSISLTDLSLLDVASHTRTVEVAGATLTVRALTVAEQDEIESLLPLPLAPKVRDDKNGRIYRDETADGWEEKAHDAERRRRALRAAIAADLSLGDLAWTRDGLTGRRPGPTERKALPDGHPDRARLAYAEAIVPAVCERLGDNALVIIIGASMEAEMGKARAGSSTP